MRLFIAIGFSELKDYFVEIQNNIDNSLANLKEVSAFHLTLKFLGEVPDNQIGQIKEKLSNIKFQKFSLALDKIGVFPSENYINVIWVGVKPHDKVKKLQKDIEEQLKEFNFKKDFDFHPHITLARVKFVKDKEAFVKNIKQIKIEEKTIEAKNFKLVKSILKPEGPVYEDLFVFGFS